jgi:aspartyl-tRNA(Asn)/glutamyl-tRNA(Gln) amidotransferase subunit A
LGEELFFLPTLPMTAPRHEDAEGIAEARLRFSAFNAPFNTIGNSAISIPCGFDRDGLPIGLQIVSWSYDDQDAFLAAAAYQQATDWHKRPPPL